MCKKFKSCCEKVKKFYVDHEGAIVYGISLTSAAVGASVIGIACGYSSCLKDYLFNGNCYHLRDIALGEVNDADTIISLLPDTSKDSIVRMFVKTF